MGDKIDKARAFFGSVKKNSSPELPHAARLTDALARPFYLTDPDDLAARVFPDDALPMAEEVLRLREIKALIGIVSGACSEALDEAEMHLHTIMSTKGPLGFQHKGQRFALSSTNYVQAKKELGGTGNPALKQWLIDNGAPDVAEGTINATTLKSTINDWRKKNPIEMAVPEGDDQRFLEGQELLDALGLEEHPDPNDPERLVTQQEQYDARVAEHARLESMVNLSSSPALSVTKVA